MNLNEKIEERNEDLVKLRKKITGTVQVLTHVKEKLQFVQASISTHTHTHTSNVPGCTTTLLGRKC